MILQLHVTTTWYMKRLEKVFSMFTFSIEELQKCRKNKERGNWLEGNKERILID